MIEAVKVWCELIGLVAATIVVVATAFRATTVLIRRGLDTLRERDWG
jgi:hypothetical protein